MFLMRRQPKVEMRVVVINYIEQRREPAVVIEAAFVRRLHEQTVFSHEQPGEIHCLIDVVRGMVGFETIDSDVAWLVQVPAWFSPKWLDMTVIATSLAAEERKVWLRWLDTWNA